MGAPLSSLQVMIIKRGIQRTKRFQERYSGRNKLLRNWGFPIFGHVKGKFPIIKLIYRKKYMYN